MIILSKRTNLILAIVSLTLAVLLIVGALGLAFSDETEGATDKEFTLIKYERYGGKYPKYEFYVEEESKPLIISNIVQKCVDTDAISYLRPNEVLRCKVIEENGNYCYEILELTAKDNVILSFDDSKQAYKTNSTIGLVLVSVFAALAISFAVILFYRAKHGYSEKYKNASKKNLINILQQNTGLTEREKELLISAIDSVDMSDTLPCEKDELLKVFENSFFTKGNREYTSAMEYLTNQGCNKVFRETLQSILSDGELKICYDAGTIDDSALFILYKTNGKIIAGYFLKNDETGKFDIDNDELDLSGDLFIVVKLTKKEREQLVEKIREYNRIKEDIFDIDKNLLK